MKKGKYLFSSESVTEGHPDKVCDQVSDAILDAIFAKDPNARVAVETLVTTGLCLVAGEVTTTAYVEIPDVVRATIKKIGYDDPKKGMDYESCSVLTAIHAQSPDISQGVSEGEGEHKEQGAGDQGMMFGYATNETPEFMPLPAVLANQLTAKLAEVRRNGEIPKLGPDGKSQVTIEYEDGKPIRADAIVIAQQHEEDLPEEELKRLVLEKVIKPVCEKWIDENTKFHINATGKFVMGGPAADTGLTGRKIICDTYGGHGSHGGGAFSGKDPSKVDRSGAYAARYIAKNIVASGLSDRCEVQLAYAIGVPEPVSVLVHTYGTNKISEDKIAELIPKHFPIKPAEIIKQLDLRRPIFQKTAAYGHFGRNDPDFTWEKLDKVEALKQDAGPLGASEETAESKMMDE
jgi:S-adenosylmethionine synthetase